MNKKKKNNKPQLRIADPYSKAMARVLKQDRKGLITTEEERKESFQTAYQIELSEFIRDMREESREVFYRAIIAGAMFGVLSSALINACFRFIDNPSDTNIWMIGGFVLAFFGAAIMVAYEYDRLKSKKVKSSIWYRVKKWIKKIDC